MVEVFLSYSHRDKKPVSRIAAGLNEAGMQVWWDRHLRAHQSFGLEIEAALGSARCALVAWSANARDSLWVRAEATEALEAQKLVQISLDGTKPPLPFTMVHLLNLSNWGGKIGDPAFRELAESVAAVMEGKVRPLDRPPKAGPKFAGFGRSVIVGAASLSLVVVAAGIVGVGAAGAFSADLFGVLSGGMFLAALLAFGNILTRVIKISLASR